MRPVLADHVDELREAARADAVLAQGPERGKQARVRRGEGGAHGRQQLVQIHLANIGGVGAHGIEEPVCEHDNHDAAALQRITEEIDRLERTPVRTRVYTRYSELYRWPLGIALVALAVELMLAAWRGQLP